MKKYFWIILFLFIFSRFFFLANFPFFYDSPEYYRESQSLSFFDSLSRSHESVHPAYLFLTQLFQRIIPGQNVWEISLISSIFGLVGFLSFYFLIKRNFIEKIAIFSSIPLLFFPHLWLIQTNVLHESLDFSLLLLGLLFFDFFLEKKKLIWFLLTIFILALSIFDFVGILLWAPIFLGLVFLKSKGKIKLNIIWGLAVIVLSFILSLLGLFFLFSISQVIEPVARLKVLFFGYGSGGIFLNWGTLDILRMLRNDAYILFYGYSIAAILGLIVSVIFLAKKKKWPVLIFFLSFFLPFLLIGKFWYGGLLGRYSVLIAYSLALFLGLIPWRKIYWIFIIILFLSFCPTFWVYQQKPIIQRQIDLIGKIDFGKEDLLVLSDYQRPQLSFSNALYLNGDEKRQKIIEEKIEEKLKNKKKIFISQQAIDFPYWQYDGQQIHIVSKGNRDKAQLKEFLQGKKLTSIVLEKNYPLLTIYQLSFQTE